MGVRVGIPRGLFYYQLYPFLDVFFEEIGAEVVISDRTTRKTLDEGIRICVDEACLPVKIFYGHVMNLKNGVDFLLIPRLTSISKGEYICPKFGGLPDMIRNTVKGLPKLIDTEINLRDPRSNAFSAAFEMGKHITRNRSKIKKAYYKAFERYEEHKGQLKKGIMASDIIDRKRNIYVIKEKELLNIVLIGHPYNICDGYANMNIIKKIRNNGANIITHEMIDDEVINKNCNTLPKKIFWNFGRKAIGSIMSFAESNDIDGVIYLMAFGCGIDSFIGDLAERIIRRKSNIPFITLTIDEHSGEAGMDTRIEAFIDMLRWRRKYDNNFSTHG